jgi:Amt family ammonium transporter
MLRHRVVLGLGVLCLSAGLAWAQDKGKGVGPKRPQPTPEEIKAAAQKTPPHIPGQGEAPKIDGGETAWVLISTGLVMLMVPGLALFYGGMVRRKNILSTMMQSMVALSIVGVQWLLFGYCLAFGKHGNQWIGWDSSLLGLMDVPPDQRFDGTHIPVYVHCMFQGMFAIITPALISGAIAERARFGPYCLFILLWATLVYDPLAHWVWSVKEIPVSNANDPIMTESLGFLGKQGAIDFAGGTVVHIAAGFSALAAILLLRKRRGYPEHAMHPSSMVLTLLGAGLLWFGWFGFNGGSALGSGALAGLALTATQVAAAAAGLSWMLFEWLLRGKPTALGLASGVVAGLVAVTPASGFVGPISALYIGLLAGVVCYAAVLLKPKLGYDDSLDAFGVHGIGGFLGALLTGLLANIGFWQAASGFPGSAELGKLPDSSAQFLAQLLAAAVAAGYAFVVTLVLVKAIDLTLGFTTHEKAENEGLDRTEHGEVGFDLGPALQEIPAAAPDPRPASVPPDGKRHFDVVVEGPAPADLIHVWSELCQAGSTPPPEFRNIYSHMTTVQGNRFHFRGGEPNAMRDALQRLFQDRLGGAALRTHIE